MRIKGLCTTILFLTCIILSVSAAEKFYNVRKYGAKGDGIHLDSPAIQKAIDSAFRDGGGTVVVKSGTYLSATIQIKDNVSLRLEKEARILGIPDYRKYSNLDPFTEGLGQKVGNALIVAVDASNISIEGEGEIDGQGALLKQNHIAVDKRPEGQRWGVRPFLLRFVRCHGLNINGIKLRYAGAWTSHYFNCTDVEIHNVSIISHGVAHNDGIDIDGCQRVNISGCDIESGDDALCFKTTSSKMSCSDIHVWNMRLKSNQAGIKMGTESMAAFEHIIIDSCYIYDTKNGGIKLFSVDGANMHDISISHIRMDNIRTPLMFRLGARLKVFRENDRKQEIGSMTDISISDVIAKSAEQTQLKHATGILITGIPQAKIGNISLKDIHIALPGGGTSEEASHEVKEAIDEYPEVKTFGPVIPAYGIWARHIDNLVMENVTFDLENPDKRPKFIFNDVTCKYIEK